MQVRVTGNDSPIPGHFIIEDGERSRQHTVTFDGKSYVGIGFEHVGRILASLIVRFEKPINEIDRGRAKEAYDQICGLLGSFGVTTNHHKIRAELCAECHGLGVAGVDAISEGSPVESGESAGKSVAE